jgi:hypothetical protein
VQVPQAGLRKISSQDTGIVYGGSTAKKTHGFLVQILKLGDIRKAQEFVSGEGSQESGITTLLKKQSTPGKLDRIEEITSKHFSLISIGQYLNHHGCN